MNCPKCGYLIKEGDKVCKVCGQVVGEEVCDSLSPIENSHLVVQKAANGGQVKNTTFSSSNEVKKEQSFTNDYYIQEEKDEIKKVTKEEPIKEEIPNKEDAITINDLRKVTLDKESHEDDYILKKENNQKKMKTKKKVNSDEIIAIIFALLCLIFSYYTKGISICFGIVSLILGTKYYKTTKQNSIGFILGTLSTIIAFLFLTLNIFFLATKNMYRVYKFSSFEIKTNSTWKLNNSNKNEFINQDGRSSMHFLGGKKLQGSNTQTKYNLNLPDHKDRVYKIMIDSFVTKNEKIISKDDIFRKISEDSDIYIAHCDTKLNMTNIRYYFIADNLKGKVVAFRLITNKKLTALEFDSEELLKTITFYEETTLGGANFA